MKDNPYVAFSFLTGITTLGKESIFSGFNSAKVDTIFDSEYAPYFGFTVSETKALLRSDSAYRHYKTLVAHYDGYRFGREDIFNPWSVSNFINHDYQALDYWRNTSDNEIVRLATKEKDYEGSFVKLLKGEAIFNIEMHQNESIQDLFSKKGYLWTLLALTGYITLSKNGGFKIPNIEVAHAFQYELLPNLGIRNTGRTLDEFESALINGDAAKLQASIEDFLLDSVSSLCSSKEDFYHGFITGLSFFFRDIYETQCEYERGYGRSDVFLRPRSDNIPPIVIEVKQANTDNKPLENHAKEALEQIERKAYDHGFVGSLRYGIAFRDKSVIIEKNVL